MGAEESVFCFAVKREQKIFWLPEASWPYAASLYIRPTPCHAGAEAWQAIPGVSAWVMTSVRWGYTLQFAQRPDQFSGVLATTVCSEDAQVLRAEVMNQLEKGAI